MGDIQTITDWTCAGLRKYSGFDQVGSELLGESRIVGEIEFCYWALENHIGD